MLFIRPYPALSNDSTSAIVSISIQMPLVGRCLILQAIH
jgi:hypothetical protein